MIHAVFVTESALYDREVYRFLLARILRREVQAWRTDVVLSGWRSVLGLGPTLLERAERDGVRHALVAIDNDGGAVRHPEHELDHDVAVEAARPDGCRTCRLLHALPPSWAGGGRHRCVVVPVQTLETWLLCIRGSKLNAPTPEQFYGRRALKRSFFGRPLPPERGRVRLAVEVLERPGALDVLRERRSYRFFEMQICGW